MNLDIIIVFVFLILITNLLGFLFTIYYILEIEQMLVILAKNQCKISQIIKEMRKNEQQKNK